MNERESKTNTQPAALGLSGKSIGLLTMIVLLFVAVRAGSEVAMIREFGSDAQMAIWIATLAVKLGLWLLTGLAAVALIAVLKARRWLWTAGVLMLIVWSGAIWNGTIEYDAARRALADARRRETSPTRLAELVHFTGIQAGYELDNRLAANPSTPPEALRTLSQRANQPGTRQQLARNPFTPPDVREQLQGKK